MILLLALSIGSVQASETDGLSQLDQVLEMPHRQGASARDKFRNPAATLAFFEVQPHHSVVEVWPGSGWYTQILAPYLRDKGSLYAAHFDPATEVEYFQQSLASYKGMLDSQPELYDQVHLTAFDPPESVLISNGKKVDRVLTFRNAHNWYMRGGKEERLMAAFQSFYDALKPGGILGIVDHRLPEESPDAMQDDSGYLKQSYVIKVAELVGFQFVGSSEINQNVKDTADHPHGVWSLPPRLRGEDAEKAKYEAIGESDRMTLKFKRPAEPGGENSGF